MFSKNRGGTISKLFQSVEHDYKFYGEINIGIFREINVLLEDTVWKSILKRYHAEKISVKPQHKNLLFSTFTNA